MIGRVLPKPPNAVPWTVQLVARIEQVDASIDCTSAVVRLQPTWRQAVYEIGFAHVTRHYPLALEWIDFRSPDVRDVIDPRVFKRLHLWRAITIERGYHGDIFTGELSLGQAYVAQTFDRLGLFADLFPATTVRKAFSERRSKLRAIKAKARMTRLHRTEVSELLKIRLSKREYDVSHTVSLDSFRTLLPPRVIRALELYGSEGVPLVELERKSADAVFEISESLLPTLVYQLDVAVRHAECASPIVTGHLSDEDDIALGMLAL
ncbi:hypothetical protein [Bradyrhizobium sp.]|uniref:hypothetical protein n=1 Tax=Bradyrhizobium sp. TaxID=376 RepID=UPI001ECC8040|nr:hypothetical protein [Bradyrhizobium sp.]MBV9978457.1 hypothetical protein [Bradyrhizobium sp.]